jgi:hypothetical protein
LYACLNVLGHIGRDLVRRIDLGQCNSIKPRECAGPVEPKMGFEHQAKVDVQ